MGGHSPSSLAKEQQQQQRWMTHNETQDIKLVLINKLSIFLHVIVCICSVVKQLHMHNICLSGIVLRFR